MSDRILLVEDDAELGRQVADQLQGAGYAVDWLRNGDEALLVDPTVDRFTNAEKLLDHMIALQSDYLGYLA